VLCFSSKPAENFKTGVRLKIVNQGLIDPQTVFNRDRDRDENFKIKAWLKNKNQSPVENF